MYVELHLLGGFAGDKSQEAMQSHGWGNGRKVQEGCVSAVFVESGWDGGFWALNRAQFLAEHRRVSLIPQDRL